jgi:hypothetical protein
MGIRVGRIIIAAISAEILAVLTLVIIVALFGPGEPEAARSFAERSGLWVGPVAGFALTMLGGWWVAKNLLDAHLLNGLVLGITAAAVDIAILVAAGSEFQAVFAFSNIGRVLAGTIGGWIASVAGRSRQSNGPRPD